MRRPPRALIALLAVLGCETPVDPIEGAIEITPPPAYSEWWDDTERCARISGDFLGVRWFVAFELDGSDEVVGQWTERREIILRSDTWLDSIVVRHEILHDLLGGDRGHEGPEWDTCDLRGRSLPGG